MLPFPGSCRGEAVGNLRLQGETAMVKRAGEYDDIGRRFRHLSSIYRAAGFRPECEHLFTVGGGEILTGWPPLAVLAAERGLDAALAYTASVEPQRAVEVMAGLLGVPAAWLGGFTRGWHHAFDEGADAIGYALGVSGWDEPEADGALTASAGWSAGFVAAYMVKADRGLCPGKAVPAC